MKKIYGSYDSNKKARNAVKRLLDEGYKKDQIKVVAKEDLDKDLGYMKDADNKDNSVWESIKDVFTFSRYNDGFWNNYETGQERTVLEKYKPDLEAGDIVVLVEEPTPDWDDREEEFYEDLD